MTCSLGLTAKAAAVGPTRPSVALALGIARVVTTGARIARVAEHLHVDSGAGSEMAIDALVVATAVRLGGGIVVTHDPVDLRRLAAAHPNIAVEPI